MESSPSPTRPSDARRPRPESLQELGLRAAALEGHSVAQLADALGVAVPKDAVRTKGFVGQLVEWALGADPQARDRPDFPRLRVELKTIPVAPSGKPLESTFCCGITLARVEHARWESSRLRQRLERVLWVPIHGERGIPLAERRIGRSVLWSPSSEEAAQLRADWEDLMGALGSGAQPSAHEGVYLQVRPKAANSSVRTLGPGEEGHGQRLPLGFYLRATFTERVLNA